MGILGQSNLISDDGKDAKDKKDVLYNVSDIIRIGMNQATYLAHQKKIKTDDYLVSPDAPEKNGDENNENKFIKNYIANRCIPACPDHPIYVTQYRKGIQRGILTRKYLEKVRGFDYQHYFCLFHVMLHTLRYTNQVVVDISRNSVQALFWLGVAHGSDVHAITVRHVPTERDRNRPEYADHKPERKIFDVAGLWTAVLQSNDTESFYRQLALVQLGIEQRQKLMLEEVGRYEEEFLEKMYKSAGVESRISAIRESMERKNWEERQLLESYYRDRFWRHMLRYNELGLYVSQKKTEDQNKPRLMVVKWDVDAMAELSHYLSKRTVIGKYHQEMPDEDHYIEVSATENFISIGGNLKPLMGSREPDGTWPSHSLAEYIKKKLDAASVDTAPADGCNVIRALMTKNPKSKKDCVNKFDFEFRGFHALRGGAGNDVYAQFPQGGCYQCIAAGSGGNGCANEVHCGPIAYQCEMKGKGTPDYYQPAQLLLWRDVEGDEVKFRVSLVGVSGPATKALTALLVDDEQKDKLLQWNSGTPQYKRLPLYALQTRIREIFRKRFSKMLDAESRIGDMEILESIKNAAQMYLSTVLYQYFLPFLSRADEDRLCNGMYAYLTAPGNVFKESDAQAVRSVLRTAVEHFCGVEALYQVKVRIKGEKEDSREVVDMEPLELKNTQIPTVSCLFTHKLRSNHRKEKTINQDRGALSEGS